MITSVAQAKLSLHPFLFHEAALFLDFDGTIADIVVDPSEVRVETASILHLTTIYRRLNGALAIVSGRSIADIDGRLKPLLLPVAGVHGLTRRNAEGSVEMASVDGDLVHDVVQKLEPFVRLHPGLLLEPKWGAVALHYRVRPELERDCIAALEAAVLPLAATAEILHGKMVVEAKFARHDKGTAVRRFMSEKPFKNRRPIFVGDDVTDEDGFAAVIDLQGLAVKVGLGPSVATTRFNDAASFRDWLALIAEQPEG